jgi:Protein of unknown function (DUF2798)
MEGKAKFIFPILATGIIVFVVSCVVTFTNIGLRPDFVPRWLSGFVHRLAGCLHHRADRISLRAPGDRGNRRLA